MLARARRLLGPEAVLIQRAMPGLGVDGVFDAVISTFDALNYLPTPELGATVAANAIAREEVDLLEHSAAAVREAYAEGQRDFGENRVQEALEKWPPLLAKYPDVRLHEIGRLQSNKVAEAVKLFDEAAVTMHGRFLLKDAGIWTIIVTFIVPVPSSA